MALYDAKFYGGQADGSEASARLIAPEILSSIPARTSLDVGCGVGTWAKVFKENGLDAWGIDGPWVTAESLRIPVDRFAVVDFEQTPYAPKIPERFDLVTTFEFLEHVSADRAPDLVEFLTSRADVVVAGAAIPGQGGANHVNEQWPAYWASLFEARGYVAYDFLRPLIWHLDAEPWYPQNIIGYFKGGVPALVRERAEAAAIASLSQVRGVVHPELFRRKIGENEKLRHKIKWGPLRKLVAMH
jgi:SAM-dependent methyltransferase